MRGLASLFTALCLFFLAGTASAQDPPPAPASQADLERRVRELEEIVRRLQAERAATPSAPLSLAPTAADPINPSAPPSLVAPTAANPSVSTGSTETTAHDVRAKTEGGENSPQVLAGWDNGYFLRSEDKKHTLRFTGQIQTDYRAFLDENDRTDIDTFLVRRARLGIEATVFDHYEFRLLPDFSNGQAPGLPARTRIEDAYLNVRYWDYFQVESGKFKQPFSYEQLIQDRFVPTLERSLIDQLVPARDVGIMIHGQKVFCDRLEYGVAVSNGQRDGDFDTNDMKDLNARLAVRPFNHPDLWPALRLFQIGVSGSTGVEQEPVQPLVLRTPATVPWFQFNATVFANGLRNRLSPEISYFYQGFGFASQYFRQDQELQPAFAGPTSVFSVDVPFEGFYVLATWLATGEERTTYSEAITPLRPFDPHCPCFASGAWELVGRVSRLKVGNVVFTPGPANLADPARFSSGATEMTLGFNWYMNRWVRLQFNWEHAWFDAPVRLGPGLAGLLRQQDSLLTRFQVIF